MRTLFLMAALAGGLAMAGPATADEPKRMWNGFSAGIHAGGVFTQYTGAHDSAETPLMFERVDGVQPTVGFQLAYDRHLTNHWVVGVGIAMSFAFGDVEGDTNAEGDTLSAETDYLADASIRIGYAANRWLGFARGGVAFANYDGFVDDNGFVAEIGEGNAGLFFGGGVQYLLTDKISILGEGLYYAFDDENAISDETPDSDAGDRFGIDGATVFRLGVSYHF